MQIADAPQVITRAELDALLQLEPQTTLSLYHPTRRVAVEPEENSLHLKNLLGRAQESLEQAGLRRPDVDAFLEPLEALLNDRDFWLHQLEGLAIFRTKDSFRYFRVPYAVPDAATVANSVQVKPLLPALWPDARFFVLALSQASVRLLHCTRHGAENVDLSQLDIPTSLEEALRYDDLQKPDLAHHPVTGPGRGPVGEGVPGEAQGGRRGAFHGHGEHGEGQKTQIKGFLLQVDKGLHKILATETAPLVLAGVDYVQALFRDGSSYRNILDEHVEGNFDRLGDDDLHKEALPIIERKQREEISALVERYGSGEPRGLSSCDLEEVLLAAYDGRVDTLFLRGTEEARGSFDGEARKVIAGPDGDADLHEVAARLAVLNGGTVYLLGPEEMPCEGSIAALFRYNPTT